MGEEKVHQELQCQKKKKKEEEDEEEEKEEDDDEEEEEEEKKYQNRNISDAASLFHKRKVLHFILNRFKNENQQR